MELERAFGVALKMHRVSAGLSQESLSVVSSRTYVSTLERGLKSPTLDKIDEIASAIGSHPLSILVSCYLQMDETQTIEELFLRIRHEVQHVKDGS